VFAVLLAVAVMGMTNFIFQSVPVWIVALVMIAYSMARADHGQIRVSGAKFIYVLFACTVFALGVSLKQGYGKVMLASAFENIKNRNFKKAHLYFEKGVSFAGSDGVFYMRYGRFLIHEERIKEAKQQLLTAKRYSSNPHILIDLAFCNFSEGNFQEAERNLLLAKYMVPSHFRARFALMRFYNRTNRLDKALELADETLALPYNKNNKDALQARDLALTLKQQQISVNMEKITW
jgi:tetratricopeptide (TPR) repeat protein